MNGAPRLAREQAVLLEDAVRALGIPYGRERSFRVGPGTLLTHRFLLTIDKVAAERTGETALPACFARLGVPEAIRREIAWHLADARFVHFGFEEDRGTGLFKVYLELDPEGSGLADARAGGPPVLQHLAFKWDPTDPDRRVVTLYHWHPGLSAGVIVERMTRIYEACESDESLAIARGILELAASRTGAENLRYLEVTEDDNPRRSFDVTVYDAGLRIGDIRPFLARMRLHFSIPAEPFEQLVARHEDERLGHLAGGVHREDREFFNVYFGVEGQGG